MRGCTGAVLSVLVLTVLAGAAGRATVAAAEGNFPLEFLNTKSGISMSLSGENGKDWAVERTCHDDSIADQIVFLKSSVSISLAHDDRNTIVMETPKVPRLVGVNGADGKCDSGDEGDIHWKIDRDRRAHAYAGGPGAVPAFAPKYSAPFQFDSATYDGTKKVLGAVGDNGGKWGAAPKATVQRYCYGQVDSFGNEWHTITYWDDEIPLLKAAGVDPHRQGASDGHCFWVCVNPKTPVLQFKAAGAEQFYTTPVKTYFVPKIWEQTTYLTGGVLVSFVNLAGGEPLWYRVNGGEWKVWDGKVLAAGQVFSRKNVPSVLEVRCGKDGPALRRTVVLDPEYPAPQERHGYLLWADDAERDALAKKVHAVEPFKSSYRVFRENYYQGAGAKFDDIRGIWRAGASEAGRSLSNAMVVAIEGAEAAAAEARLAKKRLLRMARLESVGFELDIDSQSPSKDYLNELGQTLEIYGDAAVAYDMLASRFRRSQHADGVTPIEELLIRDNLAKIAKMILQFRDNNSCTHGSGDSHWAHGYELALGMMALAMPTYKSPCYGVSGGDRRTVNDQSGPDGKFWNPFPDQGVTWYAVATDPKVPTPGYPNLAAPFRAEFLLTDDGWWSGPNDLIGDSDRYPKGLARNTLVDVKWGGLANAECRVELIEQGGYEDPFVSRACALDLMRRIKGDENRALCVTNYLRRRLVCGVVPVVWDEATKTHKARAPRIESAIYAFNRHYEYASLPGPKKAVGKYLSELKAYYGIEGTLDAADRKRVDDTRKILYDPYALAMCEDPAALGEPVKGPNKPPIVKPLFKAVVKPSEQVWKDIIAEDLDGDDLKVAVAGLPEGAAFDANARRITWQTKESDAGVYLVAVTADDGQAKTSRPFAIIVKPDAGKGRIPAAPTAFKAAMGADGKSVQLNWSPPAGVEVKAFFLYRDGVLWAALPGDGRGYVDRELITPTQSTRYDLSLVDDKGSESFAASADPAVLHTWQAEPATTRKAQRPGK